MNKRAIRKAGYKSIFKENISHQETFENLRSETDDPAILAEELSKIPSKKIIEFHSNWKWAVIGSLILVALLRIITTIVLIDQLGNNSNLLLLLVIGVVVAPGLGLYGMFTGRLESVRSAGFLIAFGIIRGFTNNRASIDFDIYTIIGLLPSIIAIGLSLYIPILMKTKLERKVTKDVDNKTQINFVFENLLVQDDDILDAEL